MSVSRPLTYLGFAAWVSVCAAAPEFIWQGLMLLLGHFSLQNVYSIILIGLILTVFVEPILERARDGRWTSEHRNTRSLLLTAPIAFTFGLVAVGLHECMTAFLGSNPAVPGSHEDGVVRGVNLILEWALIPAAVTLAWFGGRLRPPLRIMAAFCAGLWVVGVSWIYDWPIRDIVMTSTPSLVLIVIGQRYVAREWNEKTFCNLGIRLLAFISAWMALTLLLQAGLRLTGIVNLDIYEFSYIGDDIRFYLGWAIGLAIAPNPLPPHARVDGKRGMAT